MQSMKNGEKENGMGARQLEYLYAKRNMHRLPLQTRMEKLLWSGCLAVSVTQISEKRR